MEKISLWKGPAKEPLHVFHKKNISAIHVLIIYIKSSFLWSRSISNKRMFPDNGKISAVRVYKETL